MASLRHMDDQALHRGSQAIAATETVGLAVAQAPATA
jgi:hypothetical protein